MVKYINIIDKKMFKDHFLSGIITCVINIISQKDFSLKQDKSVNY